MRVSRTGLAAAEAALRVVLPLAKPADATLRAFFRAHSKLSSNDRELIAEIAFGVLRHRRTIEYLLARSVRIAPEPRQMALGWLAKACGLNLRELEPHVSAVEARWITAIKAIALDDMSLGERAELPDWLVEKLSESTTEDEILALGRGLAQPASLDLRVNTLSADRAEVLDVLRADGIAAEPTPYSPIGIRVAGRPALNRHALLTSGKIEVQDEGSQLLGFLVAPKRRDMVVDFCAGAGGKTLLMGAMMQSQGRLYAWDVSDKRLANLKTRLRRSGLSNVHPQSIQNENDLRIKRLTGKIDRVLVDAPCSGLGTLRRNPDLKWRQSAASVAELKEKQRAILAAASRLLKAGGRLVYATCSFLPDENRRVVDDFLEHHPGFRLLNCDQLLAQAAIPLETGETFQVLPHTHDVDGFFAVAMERTA